MSGYVGACRTCRMPKDWPSHGRGKFQHRFRGDYEFSWRERLSFRVCQRHHSTRWDCRAWHFPLWPFWIWGALLAWRWKHRAHRTLRSRKIWSCLDCSEMLAMGEPR